VKDDVAALAAMDRGSASAGRSRTTTARPTRPTASTDSVDRCVALARGIVEAVSAR
jgi:hypothetical protein